MHDVLIVGGGPAGLNAALVLGRSCRRVVLCDAGNPRNANSRGVNGFLSRDGIDPHELRRIGREQLAAYDGVEVHDATVSDLYCTDQGFEGVLDDGTRLQARKVLLATGLEIDFPEVDGLAELYGRGVFDCPYCDGWDVRGQPIAVYGPGDRCHGFALELLGWSRDVVLLTGGPANLSPADCEVLARHGIRLIEDPVARVEGSADGLERIRFADGGAIERRALFFVPDDRRIVLVRMAAHGEQALDEMEAFKQDRLQSILSHLDERQLERVAVALDDLRQAVISEFGTDYLEGHDHTHAHAQHATSAGRD